MNHTTPCDPTVAPRPDSPALQAAFDAISRDARRTVIELTKSAARGFLALDTRWRLNLLWRGLEVTDPEEALAVLDRVAALPSYQLASRRTDIRGARLAFRWMRFVESREEREPVPVPATCRSGARSLEWHRWSSIWRPLARLGSAPHVAGRSADLQGPGALLARDGRCRSPRREPSAAVIGAEMAPDATLRAVTRRDAFRLGPMDQHEPWQLEGTAAELYERYLVPAITALWAADLVERAAPHTRAA